MVKRVTVIILSLIFFSFSIFAADKKETKKKEETKKQEETQKTSTVVQRMASEPKNAPYKEKFGVGVDLAGKSALIRTWLSNKFALEATAGLSFASGNPASFGLKLGGNIVFPVIDDQKFRLDLTPGLLIKYAKNDPNEILSSLSLAMADSGSGGGDISTLQFLFGVGLSFEVFLNAISDDLSIGSQIGLGLGIKSISAGATSTSFVFAFAEDIGIIPIIIRYYL